MSDPLHPATPIIRFGPFELDLRSGELRKNGSRVGLQGQPLQILRLRDALGDSADRPRFVETVPRRGYRFIGAINGAAEATAQPRTPRLAREGRRLAAIASVAAVLSLAALGYVIRTSRPAAPPPDRTLTRLTFAPGLQTEPQVESLGPGTLFFGWFLRRFVAGERLEDRRRSGDAPLDRRASPPDDQRRGA